MKRFIQKSALLLISGLVFSGCAFKTNFLTDDFKTGDAYFAELAPGDLIIVDERADVDKGDLKVPAIALREKKGRIQPELVKSHRDLIGDEIKKHLGSDSRKIKFVAFITKGEKGFVSSWKGDQEKVKFAIRIEYFDEVLKKELKTSGEASYEVSSITSSGDYIEKAYQKAIRNAIHESFVSLKEYYAGK